MNAPHDRNLTADILSLSVPPEVNTGRPSDVRPDLPASPNS